VLQILVTLELLEVQLIRPILELLLILLIPERQTLVIPEILVLLLIRYFLEHLLILLILELLILVILEHLEHLLIQYFLELLLILCLLLILELRLNPEHLEILVLLEHQMFQQYRTFQWMFYCINTQDYHPSH
jgi:hypothetical protein